MQSASESSSPQPQRLPVNPRRHKVAPEQRKRVVRACNACNVRRIRCSGELPCQKCSKSSRVCEYSAPESDRNALKTDNERLRKRCAALEGGFMAVAPEDAKRLISQLDHVSKSNLSPLTTTLDDGETNGGGRLPRDADGHSHFSGETSGTTFLDSLKAFISTLAPISSNRDLEDGSEFVSILGKYQTFDSRPLPDPDVNPIWLPTRTDMKLMLVELRHLIQDGNGDFLSGGMYFWGDLSSLPPFTTTSGLLSTVTTDDTYRALAFYHVCFALASFYRPSSVQYPERHSEAYFNRARRLLGNPLDIVRFTLSDVPVLALMGFYLVELNRRDAAYMYVSMAIHIAVIHGAFSSPCGEAEKRIYWTLYILDRWLSVLMGRPPTITDQAIKIALPCDLDFLPPIAGLRAHIDLAKLTGYIVCEVFNVAPQERNSGYTLENIDKVLHMLEQWQSRLPSVLALKIDQPTRDLACCMLHVAQHQLCILITRPILLAVTKEAIAKALSDKLWSLEQHPHARYIRACSEAAYSTLGIAQSLEIMMKPLQASLHCIFDAAVILLLTLIVTSDRGNRLSPMRDYAEEYSPSKEQIVANVQFALNIFEQESKTGTNYPRDCLKVLKDLKALVDSYLSHGYRTVRTRSDADHSGEEHFWTTIVTWMQADELQMHGSLLI